MGGIRGGIGSGRVWEGQALEGGGESLGGKKGRKIGEQTSRWHGHDENVRINS